MALQTPGHVGLDKHLKKKEGEKSEAGQMRRYHGSSVVG
jgi:hypothetical protein